MGPSRIVTVFGATGLQGSAVARTLFRDGTFIPRAITRNPESAAALNLMAEGIEVVKADPLDKASLLGAMRGSEALTAPIFPLKAEGEGPNEIDQGRNIVDAAKEAGVKFFIFTSLPDIRKLSGGKYKNVLHYDHKVVVEEYLRSSGLNNVCLHLGGFLENYWTLDWLKKTTTGFDLNVPHVATDRGCLHNIFGKTYPIINENISFGELADLTGNVLGAKVTLTTAPPTGIEALDEMHQALAELNGIFPATPVPDFVTMGVKISTIKEFLETEAKPRFS
ncbi:NmrA domain-containing protein [Mycena venus]|uniref:NmrA domain-containing protein n=1 Tax=Mycena venus TaxID=2733690 RepID=A0A8H6YRP5_9AGAR|nr:NmrA domain-containing protein [Mycena venus]